MSRETVLLKDSLIGKCSISSVAEQSSSIMKNPNVPKEEHFYF